MALPYGLVPVVTFTSSFTALDSSDATPAFISRFDSALAASANVSVSQVTTHVVSNSGQLTLSTVITFGDAGTDAVSQSYSNTLRAEDALAVLGSDAGFIAIAGPVIFNATSFGLAPTPSPPPPAPPPPPPPQSAPVYTRTYAGLTWQAWAAITGSTAGALLFCYATKSCLPLWAWLCALLGVCWRAARAAGKALVSTCVCMWSMLRRARPAEKDVVAAEQYAQRVPAGTYDFAAAVDAVVPQPASQQVSAKEHPPQEEQNSLQAQRSPRHLPGSYDFAEVQDSIAPNPAPEEAARTPQNKQEVHHGVSHLPVNYDFVDLVESKEADIGHQVMAMQDLEQRPQQSYQGAPHLPVNYGLAENPDDTVQRAHLEELTMQSMEEQPLDMIQMAAERLQSHGTAGAASTILEEQEGIRGGISPQEASRERQPEGEEKPSEGRGLVALVAGAAAALGNGFSVFSRPRTRSVVVAPPAALKPPQTRMPEAASQARRSAAHMPTEDAFAEGLPAVLPNQGDPAIQPPGEQLLLSLQVPAVAEVVGGPVGMVAHATTWEAPLQGSEAEELETHQERVHESPAPLAGEESVRSRSTRDMQGTTAAPSVDAKHEEDMQTGEQPEEQANEELHVPQQEADATGEPAAELSLASMSGDGLEELRTAQTSLDSADVGFYAKLAPDQPQRHQQLKRRHHHRQQVLEDQSLAGMVQRLRDEQSAQPLPAFAHVQVKQHSNE